MLLLSNAQRCLGLGAGAARYVPLVLAPFHEPDSPVVAGAGRFLLSELPVSHGLEQPNSLVRTLAKLIRLLQGGDRRLPLTVPIPSHAERELEPVFLRSVINGLLGKHNGASGIAELRVRARSEKPGQLVGILGAIGKVCRY